MISGGIKFFGENVALYDSGGSILASTGTVAQNYAIDKLSYTKWQSVGSNDVTVETLTLFFESAEISRLLLIDHNFKAFNVQYWNGSAWTHFASVTGLDGSKANITETAFADDTAYYEFTPVTTTQIRIQITSTQTVNAEKYIATIMPTTELGTLSGFPTIAPISFSRNPRTMRMLSGRVKIVKQQQVVSISLQFQNYPVNDYGADIDLINTLIDRETPFHIWVCGGRRGSNYFSYPIRGYGLKNCYRVQIDSDLSYSWTDNIFKSGQNLGDLVFTEHV